jgi:exosortase/archaeosortase family protein
MGPADVKKRAPLADGADWSEGGLPGGSRKFIVRFVLVAAALLTIYYFPREPGGAPQAVFHAYLSAYARLAGGVLSLFDSSVHVRGTEIDGRTALDFATNCDAMDVCILLAAAIFAFPARWGHRIVGLLTALGSVLALNVLRIVSLYFLQIHFPKAFEFFHMQLWPLAIVALATAWFLVWARAAGVRRVPGLAGAWSKPGEGR